MKKLFVFYCLLASGLSNARQASEQGQYWLTGIIVSAQSQVVSAPKGSNWRVQVQWMASEGEIVQAGDLIAVFDSGSIQTDLDQAEERLAMERLELNQIQSRQKQFVTEAEGKLKLAEISLNKRKVQTAIPEGEISAYDRGKYQIDFEKALVEKIKAEQLLERAIIDRDVAVNKQQIEITKLAENIAYRKSQLTRMNVVSELTGPVSHMMHPHDKEKISPGMNVQVGWDVMKVQAQESYQIESWVHELDAANIDFDSAHISLSLDAYPGQAFSGELLSISSQTESKKEWSDSAYFGIKIGFTDFPQQPIYPGMSVRITLSNGQTHRRSEHVN